MIPALTEVVASLPGWFFTLLLLPAPPAEAAGRDVAVLLREEVPVYRRFADRFVRTCECSARRVALGTDPAAAAAEVRSLRPAAVVAVGRSGLQAASRHLTDLPLIHALVVNPHLVVPEGAPPPPGAPLDVDPAESLALLAELAPQARRVAVVHDPSLTAPAAAAAARAATRLGLTLDVRTATDAAGALRAVGEVLPAADAVLLLPDRTVLRPEILDHLLLQALERRVPVMGLSERHVRRGALFSLSVAPEDVAVEAATLIEGLLAGESRPPPGRRRLRLHLNLRTAGRLGLQVPDTVRHRAAGVVR